MPRPTFAELRDTQLQIITDLEAREASALAQGFTILAQDLRQAIRHAHVTLSTLVKLNGYVQVVEVAHA